MRFGRIITAPVLSTFAIMIFMVALTIAGCGTVSQATSDIQQLCAVGVPLASVSPVGVYVTAACATDEVVNRLAQDPTTVMWLNEVIDQLKDAKSES